jgi:hypothetical protein
MSVYIVAGRMIGADSECALKHGFPYRELRGHVQTRDGKSSMITYENVQVYEVLCGREPARLLKFVIGNFLASLLACHSLFLSLCRRIIRWRRQ